MARVEIKTGKDFDELNALSIEDIDKLHKEFGYDFVVKNGKIVAFEIDEM